MYMISVSFCVFLLISCFIYWCSRPVSWHEYTHIFVTVWRNCIPYNRKYLYVYVSYAIFWYSNVLYLFWSCFRMTEPMITITFVMVTYAVIINSLRVSEFVIIDGTSMGLLFVITLKVGVQKEMFLEDALQIESHIRVFYGVLTYIIASRVLHFLSHYSTLFVVFFSYIIDILTSSFITLLLKILRYSFCLLILTQQSSWN